MNLETFMIINGIFFWVVCALAIIALLSYAFTNLMYYKWFRDDRLRDQIRECVENATQDFSDDED